jgi:hypothetical protein
MADWSFICVADMQPGSPRSFRYNPSWQKNWEVARRQIVAARPDLLLVAGDLTRDGSIHPYELEAMKADLASLPFPVHAVPGNMDTGNKHTRIDCPFKRLGQAPDVELNVTSDQLRQFARTVGPLWWSVDHKDVRFSGFADVVVNSGLPEENAFWRWAEGQAARPRARFHIWVMHYSPFADTPDEPDWRVDDPANYLNWYFCISAPGRARLMGLFTATGATRVISGHIHCRRVRRAGSIDFEIAPATSFAQWPDRWPDGDARLGFMRYDVSAAGIDPVFVPLAESFKLQGYGPGGHPARRLRDYSLAWEK